MMRRVICVVALAGLGMAVGLRMSDLLGSATAQEAAYLLKTSSSTTAEPVANEKCESSGSNAGKCIGGTKYCWQHTIKGYLPECVDSPTPTFPGWPQLVPASESTTLVVAWD